MQEQSPMHIAIVGPVASADIASLLDGDIAGLPRGYEGAPLLTTLATELLSRGHRVTVITLSSDIALGQREPIRAGGKNFEIFYCPMRRRAWRPNGFHLGRIVDLYAFERRGLRRAIEQAQPDVVHAHWTYEFALAALASGLPHVITCHDSPYAVARFYNRDNLSRSLYRWLRVLMARKVMREAKLLTTVSPYMRDEIQLRTSSPITVIPNPLGPLAFKLGSDRSVPGVVRIAMVGNGWNARKNPEPAIRAFARFRQTSAAAELHLYGHDFGAGQIAERWARQHGIDAGIVFHGVLPYPRLLQDLSGDDLLLHPAIEESFGMVIAEAMALGLPVVAGKSSGAVPWVLGSAGALCDVRDEKDIYAAIVKILMPENYCRASRSGRLRVQEMFSQQTVTSGYLTSYNLSRVATPLPC